MIIIVILNYRNRDFKSLRGRERNNEVSNKIFDDKFDRLQSLVNGHIGSYNRVQLFAVEKASSHPPPLLSDTYYRPSKNTGNISRKRERARTRETPHPPGENALKLSG